MKAFCWHPHEGLRPASNWRVDCGAMGPSGLRSLMILSALRNESRASGVWPGTGAISSATAAKVAMII